MNQERAAKREAPSTPRRAPITPRVSEEEKHALAESKRRLEAVETEARNARVQEEERKALLARAAKIPASERRAYLDRESLLSKGRSIAVALRKQAPTPAEEEIDVESLFGIDLVDS